MLYTVLMPYCWQPYKDAIEETWKFDPECVLTVDNTVVNKGIMRANNMGIDKMRRDDSDWLILLSAAIRFGEHGGLDFINQLEAHPSHLVVEAAGVYGWHLIAFNRRTIDAVGRFDCNFSPYGYDDLDYSVRFHRAFGKEGRNDGIGSDMWIKVPVDANDMGMAHGIKLSKVCTRQSDLLSYFASKWGRHPDRPQDSHMDYMRPFNDPCNSIGYWPSCAVGDVICHWDRPEEV